MPAAASLAADALPLGLAHGLTLERDVAAGAAVSRADAAARDDATDRFRREMEAAFAPASPGTGA